MWTTISYLVGLFVLLIIFNTIGTGLAMISRALSGVLMALSGVCLPYLAFILSKRLLESETEYGWYYFVLTFLLIGMMNNANVKGETTPGAYFSSTVLFTGTVLSSIGLWIWF
jgi:hypothetical protein